jgi:hypothetical protein
MGPPKLNGLHWHSEVDLGGRESQLATGDCIELEYGVFCELIEKRNWTPESE